MYRTRSALIRPLRTRNLHIQAQEQRKTSCLRSIRKKTINFRHLQKNGTGAKKALVRVLKHRCVLTENVSSHSPLMPLRKTRHSDVSRVDYTLLGKVGSKGQEIQNSLVINKMQPLISLSEAARKQYEYSTRKSGYFSLKFKPDTVFVRQKKPVPYLGTQFLSPDLQGNGNKMKKEDKNRQAAEINAVWQQIDDYLEFATKPDGNPIYQRITVKPVKKTRSIPKNHPLFIKLHLGGYATQITPRGTLVCHYGGTLDFYDNNERNARLRNSYCIGQADCDVYTSGKRQHAKTSGRTNGHNILVSCCDENRKWVGNAGGRINDPQGTKDSANVAVQWVKVCAKDKPDLPVDMPFLITTEDVREGQQFYLKYGNDFFTKSFACAECKKQEFHTIEPDSDIGADIETPLQICNKCGELIHIAVGIET